ncbi:LOW QUALITY PROTEIN: pescadillo homolog [Homalodisca vitripennis]|uniref:LOW QUALITY PROTEIN: pescadillo homolog n=1 Tax=Homalodisca vitripennis TaxID=197043 RepID=UPI001EECE3C6|nr:LOW QUALITY PROTEIN: pescadillo homolog [Homalodisca vitripennis]
MVGQRKKKYQSGEGVQYMSRARAMKKLQLTLKDFRRLCILKGIYPREPQSRKRAQQGKAGIQTLYHKKDIQFLMHEPIIWKLRDMKVHFRRLGRAKSLRKFGEMKHLMKKHPNLTLDHIVKERYPTFIDALRDLDDCLTLCFLFAMFPSLNGVPRDQSVLCRRLTIEFMHACIAAKALRKVFVSIKGYYFQVELKGQTITWIMPHQFSFQPQSRREVDFRIMSTFTQFYTVMLGFVNFRLYHSLNLYYPPTFASYSALEAKGNELVDEEAYLSERIAALNQPLARSGTSEDNSDEVELDAFPTTDDPEKLEEAKVEAEKLRKLKTLFNGLKVFLNREVPREPLTFALRCCGAEVSWDKQLFVGATFNENDETITHQIVDRPSMETQYISRYYVQPQWVFDCVNARELLPVEKYLLGCVLPPHLSPFIDPSRKEEYNPQEMPDRSLITAAAEGGEESEKEEEDTNMDATANSGVESESEDEEDEESFGENEENEEDTEKDALRKAKRAGMMVSSGKVEKEDPAEQRREEYQEFKLREKMINKKHRRLYQSMMKGRRDRIRDKKILMKKRRIIDEKKGGHKEQKQMVRT